MLVGYARVSSSVQETHLQMDALRAAGVRRVFSEKTSSVGDRPQLRCALQVLGPGKVLARIFHGIGRNEVGIPLGMSVDIGVHAQPTSEACRCQTVPQPRAQKPSSLVVSAGA